jgi:ABC-type branched-subunit amino acid transport system ATPase component
MLSVEEINVSYGLTRVLSAVSLEVRPGERVCVLGRNGVGKTTLLRSIMGLTPPGAGKITWHEKRLDGLPAHEIASRGIAYAPQDKQLFPHLTVEENVFLAVRDRQAFKRAWVTVARHFQILEEKRREKAGRLSGGQQQAVVVARALASRPRLLLLDEPTTGIQPSIVHELTANLESVLDELGCSLLLVEQNRRFAFRLATRAYILDRGMVVAEGVPDELEARGDVKRYLSF